MLRKIATLITSVVAAMVCLIGTNVAGQTDFRSIAKITTDNGNSGTAFVVATTETHCELWTNAHVVGAHKFVTARFIDGGTAKFQVVVRKLDRQNGIDVAKLFGPIPDGSILPPVALDFSNGDFKRGTASGWAMGSRLHSYDIRPSSFRAQAGRSFSPHPTPGESGGPIENQDRKVIGVVTWTYLAKRKKFGVIQPISNFTDEPRVIDQSSKGIRTVQEIGVHHADQKKQ